MEKRLDYDVKDSANAFILSLLVPTLLVTILLMILSAAFPTINKILFYYIGIIMVQLAFFLTYFFYNKKKNINMIKASKVKFNLNILQIIIIITIGVICLYGFSLLVSYLEYLLKLIGYNINSFSYLDLSNVGMLLVNIIFVALFPAICEELMFRGIVLNGLKKYGPALMIILSGLMFSIMHLSIEQSIYQFVLGCIMAIVVMMTGSIVSSIVLHFFNNAYVLFINFILPVSSSQVYEPKTIIDHISPFLLALASTVFIFALLLLLKKVSRNSEYDLFNFKKKSKNQNVENIDIEEQNVELKQDSLEIKELGQNNIAISIDKQLENGQKENENNQASDENNIEIKKKSKFVKFFEDSGNVRLVIVFALGITLWITEAVLAFIQ